jgi:hypothetical protein
VSRLRWQPCAHLRKSLWAPPRADGWLSPAEGGEGGAGLAAVTEAVRLQAARRAHQAEQADYERRMSAEHQAQRRVLKEAATAALAAGARPCCALVCLAHMPAAVRSAHVFLGGRCRRACRYRGSTAARAVRRIFRALFQSLADARVRCAAGNGDIGRQLLHEARKHEELAIDARRRANATAYGAFNQFLNRFKARTCLPAAPVRRCAQAARCLAAPAHVAAHVR